MARKAKDQGTLLREARARFNYANAQALADKCQLSRTDIAKIEGGHAKGRSRRIRAGLAQGFGVHVDDIERFLAGELGVEALVQLSGRPGMPGPDRVRAELKALGFDAEAIQGVVGVLAEEGHHPVQLALRSKDLLDRRRVEPSHGAHEAQGPQGLQESLEDSGTRLRMPEQSLKRVTKSGKA